MPLSLRVMYGETPALFGLNPVSNFMGFTVVRGRNPGWETAARPALLAELGPRTRGSDPTS